MATRAIRVDLDNKSTFMFEWLKHTHNLKRDAELVRFLIKQEYDLVKIKQPEKIGVPLTEQEKTMLISWARGRNDLKKLEEVELGELLLSENQHVWPWLQKKLLESVTFLFELKFKKN